jgi:hypothetical protein
MATTLTPNGLQPAYRLGSGSPSVLGFSLYKIYNGETYAIFNGDPVKFIASSTGRGHVQTMNTTLTATTVTSSGVCLGVFGGCQYTDPVSGKWLQRHYYPGAITSAADDIYAMVYDDPDLVFKIQADGAVPATAMGTNASIIQTAVGSTATGNSGKALQASSIATTSTLPLRIVGFVNDGRNSVNDTYTNCYVRLNTHFHRQATGVAAS